MKKNILIIGCMLVIVWVATAFTRELFTDSQSTTSILQNQNMSLETRVALLEAKVAKLEQLIQNPPIKMIPCGNEVFPESRHDTPNAAHF